MKTLRFVVTALVGTLTALAGDWSHWRGPHFNGSTDETGLPTTWSKTENVAWKAPLPGPSGSSAVVWGDYVFLSAPDAQKNLNLICRIGRMDRFAGKSRWARGIETRARAAT